MAMNLPEKQFGLQQTTPSCRELENKLGYSMRAFLRRQSIALAESIVRQIEVLLEHPDFGASPEQRCVYRRLQRQWRYFACCVSNEYESTVGYNETLQLRAIRQSNSTCPRPSLEA